MNTGFINNMLVRATVDEMMERVTEARANKKAKKSDKKYKFVLLTVIPFILWIGWLFATG